MLKNHISSIDFCKGMYLIFSTISTLDWCWLRVFLELGHFERENSLNHGYWLLSISSLTHYTYKIWYNSKHIQLISSCIILYLLYLLVSVTSVTRACIYICSIIQVHNAAASNISFRKATCIFNGCPDKLFDYYNINIVYIY